MAPKTRQRAQKDTTQGFVDLPDLRHIHIAYRLLFLYIEPAGAFLGFLITLLDPFQYLHSLSPQAVPADMSPLESPIYDQLSAHLLRFAWSQAVVLRMTSDLRTWKLILFGMFLCDVFHLWGSARILGTDVFFNPRLWRWEEWVNFIMLYGPGSLRLAFCAGFGINEAQTVEPKKL